MTSHFWLLNPSLMTLLAAADAVTTAWHLQETLGLLGLALLGRHLLRSLRPRLTPTLRGQWVKQVPWALMFTAADTHILGDGHRLPSVPERFTLSLHSRGFSTPAKEGVAPLKWFLCLHSPP